MNNFNKLYPIKRIDIELTNRCTLKCELCHRTLNKSLTKNPDDISVDFIKRLLKENILDSKEVEFAFCGNIGDSVYSPNFIPIIKTIKSDPRCRINIVTNGSKRTIQWWSEFTSLLDKRDMISFSIDGLEDVNQIYRKGSDWDSLRKGLEIACRSPAQVFWTSIKFTHNSHQKKEIIEFAKKVGVNKIEFFHSGRMKKNFKEILLTSYKSLKGKNRKSLIIINGIRKRFYKFNNIFIFKLFLFPLKVLVNSLVKIHPQCLQRETHFISSEMVYFPCCASAMYSKENNDDFFSFQQNTFSLKTHSLLEVLESDNLIKLKNSWKSAFNTPTKCFIRCGVFKPFENKIAQNPSHPDEDYERFDLSKEE